MQNLSYLLQPKQFLKKLKSGIIKNLNYTAVDIRLSPWQNSDVVMITVQVYPSHENLITWNILCTDTNINTAPLSVEKPLHKSNDTRNQRWLHKILSL